MKGNPKGAKKNEDSAPRKLIGEFEVLNPGFTKSVLTKSRSVIRDNLIKYVNLILLLLYVWW